MFWTFLQRLGWLVVLSALWGCVTPIVDQPWFLVESENFRLYSQISEPETVVLAEKLETFREVTRKFTNAGDAAFEPVIPTIVYVFGSASTYDAFAPPRSAGFIAPRQRAYYIALNGRQIGLAATRIVYHEFVHYLLRSGGTASYPRWFDEGMAEYLGSTVIDDENILFAAVPDDRIPTLRYGRLLPLKRVLQAEDTSGWSSLDNGMFYAQSWALVHYLNRGSKVGFTDRSVQLRTYIQLLNEGVPSETAVTQAFDTTFEGLGEELESYLKKGQFMQGTVERSAFPSPRARSSRRLTRAEVASQLGDLALAVDDPRKAQRLFETALALEPDRSRAIAGLAFALWRQGQGSDEERHRMLERSVEVDPKDALNHLDLARYRLARATSNPKHPEYETTLRAARDAFAKAIELAPDLPEAYAAASLVYSAPEQDWRNGKPLIEQAHALLPTDVSILITLADFCVRSEEYDRAEELLDTAARWSAETGGEQGARAIERVRSRLSRARAGAGAPDAASSAAKTEAPAGARE